MPAFDKAETGKTGFSLEGEAGSVSASAPPGTEAGETKTDG